MAGGAFGFPGFIGAGLLDIFRQVAGGFAGRLLVQCVAQMFEGRYRLWKRRREQQTSPDQTAVTTHSFDISFDLVNNRALPGIHDRINRCRKPSKNSIECGSWSQKVILDQENHDSRRMALDIR